MGSRESRSILGSITEMKNNGSDCNFWRRGSSSHDSYFVILTLNYEVSSSESKSSSMIGNVKSAAMPPSPSRRRPLS